MRAYVLVQGLLALLCLNNANGQNEPEQDEVDRLAIQQTGCKFLALGAGESVSYTLNGSSFQHIALASVGAGVSPETFQLRIAVRSDEDFRVNLISRKRFSLEPKDPDYKLEFGANKNDFIKMSAFRSYEFREQQRYIPKVLSTEKYAKFYFTLSRERNRNNRVKILMGPACEHFPVYSDIGYGSYNREIVQLDFATGSQRGAKVLYDCPVTYADCKCAA